MSFEYGSGIGQSSIAPIEALAAKSGLNVPPSSTFRPGAGYHGTSNAVDFSNGGNAGTPEMDSFAKWWFDNYAPYLLELIHVNQGSADGSNGYYVKNGVAVQGMFYGAATLEQHHNHVHVAMTNAGVQAANAGGVKPGATANDGTTASGKTASDKTGYAIFSAEYWLRVGMGLGGLALMVVGALILQKGLGGVTDAPGKAFKHLAKGLK